jgi:O-palmitoleoyl-L-serine hydrolase
MRADSVGAPVTPQQWDYIHEMGGALRTSLDNVTAVFAPACIGHSVLTKRDWQNIKIDDVSLTDSLRCWENSLAKERKITLKLADGNKKSGNKKPNKKKNQQSDQPQLTAEQREQRRKERRRQQRLKMSPEEREQKRLERRERRRQERRLQKLEAKNQTPRAQRSPQELESNNKNSLPKIIENEPAVKQQQKKRRQHRRRMEQMEARNATRVPKHHKRNQQEKLNNTKSPNKRRHGEHNRHKLLKAQNQLVEVKEPKKCGLRMLERCSWPQCNHSCPTLTNPLTGEEMKFLELLTSFGLDIYAVAQALGVDMHTLNNMDHKELIKLFTESAS